MASHGLSLTDDGRMFFTTTEPLVLRDTDGVKDAYEWTGGAIQLISTGTSQFSSELFSASADGRDVFFFTRDKLASEDQNGSVMKIYDAREEGGRFLIPASPQCAASDECHGPGSVVPPKAGIASLAGTEGNHRETKTKSRRCRKGFVRRGGKCVKKKATKPSRRLTLMTARKIVALVAAMFAIGLTGVAPAQAALQIESFTTTSSTTQAGGHPDLTTSFTLKEAGVAEAASNVSFNAPEGLFGNPNVLLECSSSDFAFTQCAPDSQAGLITVHANYEGEPSKLLGTAPIYQISSGPNTALFAFIVPVLDIPIQIPVAVRTGGDFGLRFTVAELTQTAPLASADLTFWGFPANSANDARRFPKGSPGEPAGCPGLADTSCIIQPVSASIPDSPLINNPTTCTGQSLVTRLNVQTYQDPEESTEATDSYPPITECYHMTFKPVLHADLTTNETDSASAWISTSTCRSFWVSLRRRPSSEPPGSLCQKV